MLLEHSGSRTLMPSMSSNIQILIFHPIFLVAKSTSWTFGEQTSNAWQIKIRTSHTKFPGARTERAGATEESSIALVLYTPSDSIKPKPLQKHPIIIRWPISPNAVAPVKPFTFHRTKTKFLTWPSQHLLRSYGLQHRSSLVRRPWHLCRIVQPLQLRRGLCRPSAGLS